MVVLFHFHQSQCGNAEACNLLGPPLPVACECVQAGTGAVLGSFLRAYLVAEVVLVNSLYLLGLLVVADRLKELSE